MDTSDDDTDKGESNEESSEEEEEEEEDGDGGRTSTRHGSVLLLFYLSRAVPARIYCIPIRYNKTLTWFNLNPLTLLSRLPSRLPSPSTALVGNFFHHFLH